MHQRSCRIVRDLNDELRPDLEDHLFKNTTNISENIADTAKSTNDDHSETNDFPELKKGIRLPKKDSEWLTANEFFKISLNSNAPQDAKSKIKHLNEVVYNYFSENCGQVENLSTKTFNGKYNNHSAKDLKKILKKLKGYPGSRRNRNKIRVSCFA